MSSQFHLLLITFAFSTARSATIRGSGCGIGEYLNKDTRACSSCDTVCNEVYCPSECDGYFREKALNETQDLLQEIQEEIENLKAEMKSIHAESTIALGLFAFIGALIIGMMVLLIVSKRAKNIINKVFCHGQTRPPESTLLTGAPEGDIPVP